MRNKFTYLFTWVFVFFAFQTLEAQTYHKKGKNPYKKEYYKEKSKQHKEYTKYLKKEQKALKKYHKKRKKAYRKFVKSQEKAKKKNHHCINTPGTRITSATCTSRLIRHIIILTIKSMFTRIRIHGSVLLQGLRC